MGSLTETDKRNAGTLDRGHLCIEEIEENAKNWNLSMSKWTIKATWIRMLSTHSIREKYPIRLFWLEEISEILCQESFTTAIPGMLWQTVLTATLLPDPLMLALSLRCRIRQAWTKKLDSVKDCIGTKYYSLHIVYMSYSTYHWSIGL